METHLCCDDEINNLNSDFNFSAYNIVPLSKINGNRFAKTDIAVKTKNPSKTTEKNNYSKTRLLIHQNKPAIFYIENFSGENNCKTKFASFSKLFISDRFDAYITKPVDKNLPFKQLMKYYLYERN